MMRKTTIGAVAWLMLLSNLGAGELEPTASAKPAADRGLSNTRKASCLLKITWDSSTLPLNEDVLEALLHSSGVKAHAVQEVLGLPNDIELDDLVEVGMFRLNAGSLSEDEAFLLVQLSVSFMVDDPDLVKPAAEELQAALCKRLLTTLDRLGKDEAKEAEKRLARAARDRAEAEETLRSLFAKQRALCDEAGRSDLRRESILAMTSEAERTRQKLEMERVAQQARREAIERQLAETSGRVSQQAAGDAVVAELLKVVEIQAARVARARKLMEEGSATETELLVAEEQLARAKAHLMERREAATDALGGGLMPQLNSELAHMNIEAAELNARVAFINDRLEDALPLLVIADRFVQEVGYQLPLAREALASATERFHSLQRRLRDLRPPKITVIGAE